MAVCGVVCAPSPLFAAHTLEDKPQTAVYALAELADVFSPADADGAGAGSAWPGPRGTRTMAKQTAVHN